MKKAKEHGSKVSEESNSHSRPLFVKCVMPAELDNPQFTPKNLRSGNKDKSYHQRSSSKGDGT